MTQLDQALPAKARRTGRDRATGWRDALIERQAETWAAVREVGAQPRTHLSDKATYVLGDTIQWLAEQLGVPRELMARSGPTPEPPAAGDAP